MFAPLAHTSIEPHRSNHRARSHRTHMRTVYPGPSYGCPPTGRSGLWLLALSTFAVTKLWTNSCGSPCEDILSTTILILIGKRNLSTPFIGCCFLCCFSLFLLVLACYAGETISEYCSLRLWCKSKSKWGRTSISLDSFNSHGRKFERHAAPPAGESCFSVADAWLYMYFRLAMGCMGTSVV